MATAAVLTAPPADLGLSWPQAAEAKYFAGGEGGGGGGVPLVPHHGHHDGLEHHHHHLRSRRRLHEEVVAQPDGKSSKDEDYRGKREEEIEEERRGGGDPFHLSSSSLPSRKSHLVEEEDEENDDLDQQHRHPSQAHKSIHHPQHLHPQYQHHPDEDDWAASTGKRKKMEEEKGAWADEPRPAASATAEAATSLYETPMWRQYGWIAVHLSMIVCQACFAAVNVFGKYGMQHVDPIVLVVYRNVGTLPFLMIGVLLLERRQIRECITWMNVLKFTALGVITMLVSQSLYAYGLKYTTATNSATLHLAIPVWTCVICLAWGMERFSYLKILGIACAVGGSLVMTEVESFDFSDGVMYGNFLVLLMTFLFSAYLIFCKPLVSNMPPLNVSMWIFITASVASVPLVIRFWDEFSAAMHITDVKVWVSIGLAVIVGTAIPYLLITWAIKQASPLVVAIYTPMELIATTICAIIFLDEDPGWRQALGAVFILLGLAVTTWAQQTEKKIEPTIDIEEQAPDVSETTPLITKAARQ